MVVFLKNKGEVAIQIKEHVAKIKQKFSKVLTSMRANNRKELVNGRIIKFCRTEGITIKTMAPYSPS